MIKSFLSYIMMSERKTMISTRQPAGMSRGGRLPSQIDGWENPAVSEVQGAIVRTRERSLRFIVSKDGKQSFFWDSDNAIHDDVSNGEELGNDAAWGMIFWIKHDMVNGNPVLLDKPHFRIEFTRADEKTLLKNSTIARIKKLSDTAWVNKRTSY